MALRCVDWVTDVVPATLIDNLILASSDFHSVTSILMAALSEIGDPASNRLCLQPTPTAALTTKLMHVDHPKMDYPGQHPVGPSWHSNPGRDPGNGAPPSSINLHFDARISRDFDITFPPSPSPGIDMTASRGARRPYDPPGHIDTRPERN